MKMLNTTEVNNVPKKSSAESVKTRNEGNKLFCCIHNKKIHLDILSLYNQSAAEAEIDSEEFALAVSNRSVLLMHLNMHKEALIDIDKSYNITKSDELKTKLLTRKMKCLSLIDDSDNSKLNVLQEYKPPIINKVSKTIPCAADCITIAYDKYYGRCIVATEDIEAGTIIAKEKSPVLLPFTEKTYSNCSHCLMLAYNGIPCDLCTFVIYCSEKCKKEAFLEYHDVECLILPYIEKKYKDLIFAFRLFIKFIKKEGLQQIMKVIDRLKLTNAEDQIIEGFFKNGLFQSNNFQSFCNLSLKDDNFFENFIIKPIIKRLIKILAEKTNIFKDYDKTIVKNNEALLDFLEQVVHRIKRIVDRNGFSFQDRWETMKEQMIGISITTFCSLFNHSCDDYTSRGFTENHEIFIYTLKFIKKGEQIFTNYGTPLRMDKNSRQTKLKLNYNFMCQCQPCSENWPTLSSLEIFNEYNDFSRIGKLKLLSEFQKNNIKVNAIDLFFGAPLNADLLNETNLEDIRKMSMIIQKNFTGFYADLYLISLQDYIENYFRKFSVKILNISDTC